MTLMRIMYNTTMPSLLFRAHAVQRMFERRVSTGRVRQAVETNDVVEDYSSEMPEPSRLLLAFQGKYPFHVVTSEDVIKRQITIITVYLPSSGTWRKDFRSRR
jgi:hypothetical protein